MFTFVQSFVFWDSVPHLIRLQDNSMNIYSVIFLHCISRFLAILLEFFIFNLKKNELFHSQ